jgi:hypothetical protein
MSLFVAISVGAIPVAKSAAIRYGAEAGDKVRRNVATLPASLGQSAQYERNGSAR